MAAPKFRVDRQIKAKTVRYIDEKGVQQGIKSFDDALRSANGAGLSLVEVDPGGSPPVCKALDYNRFQFEKRKKKSASTAVVKKDKEVKMATTTGDNDYQIKIKKVIKLIDSGHRVKVSIRFRFRRDQETMGVRPEIVDRVINDLEEYAKLEAEPKADMRQAIMYFLKKK
ncbi:translation initiation factor IF-3 [Candidatus Comchoanobacter bicostacola]|uniref:Translation initiation factor IF-3 n=1 Tax=Candidatus Comchoanobacter bicostacola TaxID=2919598 RepID=A0ABY5DJS0_9GAMM|nr:translation initiation factor IF-3 [Candidatus Comchoanobacter bicostacola]UTC24116.1 translation initiation factor IF-3 [Candidatus Comchoanobacter bicostacola]